MNLFEFIYILNENKKSKIPIYNFIKCFVMEAVEILNV